MFLWSIGPLLTVALHSAAASPVLEDSRFGHHDFGGTFYGLCEGRKKSCHLVGDYMEVSKNQGTKRSNWM